MAFPQHDSLPERPVDRVAIPLGPGQEPNAYGGAESFEWDTSRDTGVPDRSAVRRNPDEEFIIISRPPERW